MDYGETFSERMARLEQERNARMVHDELRTDELIEQQILKELEGH